ncbi:sn-glycerol-3-phosphate ABC transporter ATP-binding protein UgpC [Endozoicomonas gorgoniicola]|uniref:Sn-glycerol-3-phosphate ABC transporter ATP-binding protein UgpC n=1 Tax=Endozoicomonas gorgoniicola TaxID=1234144 RepID=A0ABT3MXU5_9GAMM|nr:sn-glycerol-3-phosphate ABC transporter ATP-binding protein UgpC [Endozoicomonas gorgoniicola]MCW7554202.1 sn-glycerol-3-phosphate ABC transporter ATP-binding protein UgpC [Endozoicomonas gorgoniicola]
MADLKLAGLDKSYDGGNSYVLKNINLDINDGEFVAFVGPSGCGKSTLLRMICGLEDITDGQLEIDHERVNEMPPNERRVGMVFQSYALYPHMTVAENMAFGLKLAKVKKSVIDERVKEAARILQLEPLLDRKPKAMSGGQRQRVAIGRSIVQEPRVFLFDEPLSNLDVALRVQMRQELSRIHSRLKTTAVYVTHDQVEAMTLADKIVVLSPLAQGAESNLEQVGAPLELFHHPRNKFVAGFIGSPKMNFFRGEIVEAGAEKTIVRLETGEQIVACNDSSSAKAGDKVTLGIRPQDALAEAEGDNIITGTIKALERLGTESFVYLNHPAIEEDFILRTEDSRRREEGSEFKVGVPEESCHLFNEKGLAFPRTKAPHYD